MKKEDFSVIWRSKLNLLSNMYIQADISDKQV